MRNPIIKTSVSFTGAALGAFLLAGGELFGFPSPFAAVLVSALSGFYIPAAFVGGAAGLALSGANGGTVVAGTFVLLAVGTFRLLFGRRTSAFFSVVSSLVCSLAVFSLAAFQSTTATDYLAAAVLATVAFAASFSLNAAVKVFAAKGERRTFTGRETACLSVAYLFAVCALAGIETTVPLLINAGVFSAGFVVLCSSGMFLGRKDAPVYAGVLSLLGLALADPWFFGTGVGFVVAGVFFQFLGKRNRLLTAAAFLLSSAVGILLAGMLDRAVLMFPTTLLSTIPFLVLPRSKLSFGEAASEIRTAPDMRGLFGARLCRTAATIGEVRQAVEESAAVTGVSAPKNFADIPQSAAGEVCRNCKRNTDCWGKGYNDTASVLSSLVTAMRHGEHIEDTDFPQWFRDKCKRTQTHIRVSERLFRERVSVMNTSSKISSARDALMSQLTASEKLLTELADSFKLDGEREEALLADSAAVEAILAECGVGNARAAVSRINGRYFAECFGNTEPNVKLSFLVERISVALRTVFDTPDVNTFGGGFFMTLRERAGYKAEFGAFQVAKGREKSCGDYYETFTSGNGHAYVILSDGMGSGARARVDSAFACGMMSKLIRSGVSFGLAAEITANALSVCTDDESFATLDAAEIDLCSGETTLYKAGAAPTFIKCGQAFAKAAGGGMPMGIGKPMFESKTFTIGKGDLLVMASDGADLSDEWLARQLEKESLAGSELGAIAEHIASAAKYSAEKGREDDISVIAVRLKK
ncbi:MAG: SpoIIE family protein phosphatase [Oscillospiraceae bacterium]|jgi:stage II sporulation protein E|nr:SpoIIE family protein phosphatase [Oscillospiraceae bacterium]